MEVMVVVQSGMLLRGLRVQLKRRDSARRGGDYNDVPQAIQKKSRPSPSNCVAPSACKLLSEEGFGFRKANVTECRVFASPFPSDKVQNIFDLRHMENFANRCHAFYEEVGQCHFPHELVYTCFVFCYAHVA